MILLKNNGEVIEIDQNLTEKYVYLENFIKILNDQLDLLYNDENLDIELNLVEYGVLGNELLFDPRLKEVFLREKAADLNDYGGIAIYYSGVYGDLLRDEYREEKICYIALQQLPIFNMIRLAFHELNHFFDPFPINEWQEDMGNGISYIVFDHTIRAGVRLGLNEYYANFFSYLDTLELINRLEEKIEPSSREYYIECITTTTQSYISNLDIKLIEFCDSLRGDDLRDSGIQAEITQFFCFKFFSQISYFLGAWKAYQKANSDISSFQDVWDQFLTKIIESNFLELSNFLEEYKNLTLEGFKFKNKNISLRYLEFLFLKFFHEKLLFELNVMCEVN